MALLVPLSFQITQLKGREQDPVNRIRSSSNFFAFIGFALGLPGFYVTLFMLVWLEWLTNIKIIPTYLLLFLSVLIAKVIARLYITLKSI